jgi:hypothetical protein
MLKQENHSRADTHQPRQFTTNGHGKKKNGHLRAKLSSKQRKNSKNDKVARHSAIKVFALRRLERENCDKAVGIL